MRSTAWWTGAGTAVALALAAAMPAQANSLLEAYRAAQQHDAVLQAALEARNAAVEVRPQAAGEEVALAVRRAIGTHHGVALHLVAQIKLGSLPKTTSGKVRRSACAEALQAGRLEVL